MKLLIENLGSIKKGAIDLNKNLIIITGPNNTGKSYLTYLIHGISQHELISGINNGEPLRELFNNDLDIPDFSSNIAINMVEILERNKLKISNMMQKIIKDIFTKIFASSSINPNLMLDLYSFDFKDFLVDTKFHDIKVVNDDLYGFPSDRSPEKIHYNTVNDKERFPSTRERLSQLLSLASAVAIDREVIPKTYFFPAERTAINLFARHLTSTKAEIKDELDLEVITGMSNEELGRRLRTQVKTAPKYPYAIRDYINFVNNFKKGEEGRFHSIATSIETILTGGKIHLDDFDQPIFTPEGLNSPIELHLTSSLVKSLSYLILFLKYNAKSGNQVIIDEPELNLHPDLQIALAKILASMVNAGLKVIISTHSDYLIKELNNLILLGELNKVEQHQAFIKEKGFTTNELLIKEQVGAYFLHDGTIESINLEEDGLVVPTINNAIRRVDGLAEEIFMEMEG